MPVKKSKDAAAQKSGASKAKPATVKKSTSAPKAKSQEDGLKKIEKAAKDLGMALVFWEPERLARFVSGNLTVAALENISKKKLYEMADVGYRLLTQGKLDDAEKIFAGLTVMDPYDSYFQLVLGSISQRKNDLIKAEQHYSRALEIDGNSTVAYANRGETRVMLQKLSDAITDFSMAIKLDPDSKDPAAMRARVMLIAISNKVQQLSAQKTASQKK